MVCKRWTFIIDNTPSFWTIVSSEVPRHINSAALLRSSGHPLRIYYRDRSRLDRSNSTYRRDSQLLELMVPIRPLWKSLNILSKSTVSLRAWLPHPAPNVEKITFHAPLLMAPSPDPLLLLGGNTKNVREVSIGYFPVLWTQDLFCGLRVLKLTGYNLGVTTDHILSFLAQSPFLEILDLRHLPRAARPSDSTHHSIPLHHLRSIVVRECSEGLTLGIFQRIAVSSSKQVSFLVRLADSDTTNGETLVAQTPFFQHFLQSAHGISSRSILRANDNTLEWSMIKGSADAKEPWVDVSIARVSTPFVCGWVDQTLEEYRSSDLGVELDVGYRWYPNLSEESLECLGSMLCITKLSMNTDIRDGQEFFRLLGGEYGFDTSPSFPRLQELRLTGSKWEPKELFQGVQRRFSAHDRLPDQPPDLDIFVVADDDCSDSGLFPIVDMDTVMAIRGLNGVRNLSFSKPDTDSNQQYPGAMSSL